MAKSTGGSVAIWLTKMLAAVLLATGLLVLRGTIAPELSWWAVTAPLWAPLAVEFATILLILPGIVFHVATD